MNDDEAIVIGRGAAGERVRYPKLRQYLCDHK